MKRGYLAEIFVSFQGEGVHVGRRHLFIRMAGCNLRCRYCDTPDSLERGPVMVVRGNRAETCEVANPISVEDLQLHIAALLDIEGPVDGVAVTGGEPLLQADFLAAFLEQTSLPKPRLLETSGVLPNQLKIVLPWIDVVSMDIKLPSNTGEAPFWRAHEAFLELAKGKVYVKILVDGRTAGADVDRAATLVQRVAPDVPAFLQPITDQAGRIDVDHSDLIGFFETGRRHLRDLRVLPQTHKALAIP